MRSKSLLIQILLGFSVCAAFNSAQTRHSGSDDGTGEKKLRGDQIKTTEFGEVTTAKLAGKRDLSRYLQGGHHDCRDYFLSPQKGQCTIDELNQFILSNWSNRQLGYVRLTRNTPDAGATLHIFIEPNKTGQWTVLYRMVRWHAFGPNSIIDFPRAYFVEKSASESPEGKLTFKDKFGHSIPELN
jgi:hypothetical protein